MAPSLTLFPVRSRYLKASKDNDLMPPVKEGIDTLLLYLFRALDLNEEMEKLASSPNNCAVVSMNLVFIIVLADTLLMFIQIFMIIFCISQ